MDTKVNLSRWAAAASGSALLACLAAPAGANVTPVTMGMKALSESCIVNCGLLSSYARDNDVADADFGTFTDLSVTTSVPAGANSFATSASGTTTILSDTSFRTNLIVDRPSVASPTGSYSAKSQLNFSFMTDATASPTMTIAYSVDFVRPVDGNLLDAGVSFSSPSGILFLLDNNHSVPVEPTTALFGTSGGLWTFELNPSFFYSLTLAANASVAFTSPGGFGTDRMNATFTVTLPSFAQPVPEPGEWALMIAGLAMIGACVRHRRAA